MATLAALDLRSEEERKGGSSEAIFKALGSIVQTIQEAKRVKEERAQIDRVSRALAGGASTIEAITAAANAGGPRRAVTGLDRALLEAGIGKATAPPPLLSLKQQKKAAKIEAGLKPRATAAKTVEPFEQTPEDKARNRDVDALTKRDSDDKLIASPAERKRATERLRLNPALQDIPLTDFDYIDFVKGKTKEKVGKLDNAFGEKAYNEALEEAKGQGLSEGKTEASIEADFNRWWDEQAALKDPKGFGALVIPRSEFQKATVDTTVDVAIQKALNENKITQNEFDSINRGIAAGTITIEDALARINGTK